MVSRYFMLSGIPITQTTICMEIQDMMKFIVENFDFPKWDTFEFITGKTGRRGPSKEECIGYYNQK